MLLRRITQHVKDQNWFAVVIDFCIVVIGVFIGIQVANWNDVRQERAQESIYLERIITELETSIEAQKNEVEFAQSVFDGSSLLIQVTDKGSLEGVDPKTLETSLRRFGVVRSTGLNLTTFHELQASGRINLIRNNQVRRSLSELKYNFDRRENSTPETRARFVGALDLYDQYVRVTHNPDGPGWHYEYDIETMSASDEFKTALRRGQRLAWHALNNHKIILTELESSLAAIENSAQNIPAN